MQKIVALSGFKGTGKDTSAKIISEMLSDNTRIIAFADPIKQAASHIFNIPFEVLEGRTPENRRKRDEIDPFWSQYLEGFTGRMSLTMIGTDVIRNHLLDDIWVLRVKKEILDNPETNFIISDLRDPIEEKLINELKQEQDKYDVIHINIQGKEIPSWVSLAKRAVQKEQEAIKLLQNMGIHRSEWCQVGLSPDVTIKNDKQISDLAKELERLFQ